MSLTTIYIISVAALAVAIAILDIRVRIIRDKRNQLTAADIIRRTQHRKH